MVLNPFYKENPYKRTSPKVHAGDAYQEYFERRGAPAGQDRVQRVRKYKPERISGGGGITSYLYWLVGGIAAVAIIYFAGNLMKTSGVSAKLVFQEGEVQVKSGPDSEWKKVETDSKLKKLDEIKTMEGAKAIISMNDGSIIRLDEYSRVILTGESGNIDIIQTDGGSYHRVAKNDKRKYEVEFTGIEGAKKTKIESVGTGFWVKKIGTEVSVGVLESSIVYKKEGESDISVDEGQKVEVENSQATKKDIDSDDLDDGFISWNLEQDKKKGLSVSNFVNIKLAQKSQENGNVGNETENSGAENENSAENSESSAGGESKLVLTAEAVKEGVKLTWQLEGGSAPDGFKIVKGNSADPAYPGSYYRSLKSNETRSYLWDTADGKTYHFRVCIYDGSSGCKVYSNDVSVETMKKDKDQLKKDCESSKGTWDTAADKCNCPENNELQNGVCVVKEDTASDDAKKTDCTDSGGTWSDADKKCTCEEGEVLKDNHCVKEDSSFPESVSLSASSSGNETADLSWTVSGGKASKGFKIIKGNSKDPVYPGSNPQSVKEGVSSYSWKDLKKDTTYYFRVCVWDGTKCLVYSNNQKVEIEK